MVHSREDDKVEKPDRSTFKRVSSLTALRTGAISSDMPGIVQLSPLWLHKIGPNTPPDALPWPIIDAMSFDPYVYLGEQIWAALLRNPDLYRVEHDDPAIRAETEAWLKPIKERILSVIVRAFSYGMVPYVFEWQSKDLPFDVSRAGAKTFTKTEKGHQHYSDLHDLHPAEIELWAKNDKLFKLRVFDKDYFPNRAYVSVWDRRWGGWLGNGSRRRVFQAVFESIHVRMWRGRFLERNVDPPRKGHAPQGTIEVDGVDVDSQDLLMDIAMGLKGGGFAGLPGGLEPNSTTLRAWDIEAMNLDPKGSAEVFNASVDGSNVDKFIGSLVPPTQGGIQDAAFASGRVHAELLEELLNAASCWVASELTHPVQTVHRVNHGLEIPAPTIRAREFPKAKAKRLLEVFKKSADAQREIKVKGPDGEKTIVFTANMLVDAANLLEELGVKTIPVELAGVEKQEAPAMVPGQPGRPLDTTSARQDRRDNAITPEGEDATGQEGEGVDG